LNRLCWCETFVKKISLKLLSM